MLDRARSNGKTDFNISIVPSASITISVISIETSELLPPMGCGRRGGLNINADIWGRLCGILTILQVPVPSTEPLENRVNSDETKSWKKSSLCFDSSRALSAFI
uniref:Uncharacterized protein n=1 Tax=Vespula pensylvanica TaxID=30213 RepID=A0A834NXF3_VESPE|nr:hypothetical protein H0235_010296 [Vespula pensylvanica]